MSNYDSKILIEKISIGEKDNLINAKIHAIPGGIRLFYGSSTIMAQDNIADNKVSFDIKDFLNIIEVKASNKTDKLKKICKDLLKSYVTVKTITSWNAFPMFYSIELDANNEKVSLQYHQVLTPYLLQAGRNSQPEEPLDKIIDFKSKYSTMVYELCKEHLKSSDDTVVATYTLSDLKEKLGIDEGGYPKYSDFKRNVLLQAQQEINEKSQITFEMEEEMSNRKVQGIKLLIKNK